MSIYDNVGGKLKKFSIRLTPFQAERLKHICDMFNISYQRFFSDSVDFFTVCSWEVTSGKVHISKAQKDAMQQQLDTYVELRKDRTNPQYPIRDDDTNSIRRWYGKINSFVNYLYPDCGLCIARIPANDGEFEKQW